MPTVIFILPDGKNINVKVDAGSTLMEGAGGIGISGIEEECDGNLSCATSHVYVDDEWFGKFEPIGDLERELLDATASSRRAGSRLSCQTSMNEALDRMRIYIPETQH